MPDRETRVTEPSASVHAALDRLRLEGAIHLRAEYTEGWALEGQGGPMFASMMHPGAERLILFHVIASGRCFVAPPGHEPHWAETGDVIVLPYGDEHLMGGVEPAPATHITSLVPMPPWKEMPIVRHGAGGERTDVVCGFLYSDDPLFDPALRALPEAFVVHPTGAAAKWVDASIAYALETTDIASTKLPELVLIEMLRLHLRTAPAAERGFIAALRDPLLAPAMARIHHEPGRKWTVAELAAECAVSRSLLDSRFREVLGLSPIRYLTDWRMHIAQELLATTDKTVATVAREIGYDSEEAFSRAFKRAHGAAPSHWRADRS